ncbi:MAG: quaternary ammonium compound efflux SMR transporter SugE [Candidatus Binatia bacterium]
MAHRTAWMILFFAGLLEIAWAIGLKYTDGLTRLWPSVVTGLLMAASLYCLALAVKTLPVGTSYAIWTGIGATGTAVLGILLFSESAALGRLLSLALIVIGIIGLKLTAPG